MNIVDLLDAFNWMDRIEGAVSSLIHADWKGARKHGAVGIPVEFLRTVTGANAWAFHIPRSSGWYGSEAEALLKHYGVRLWGRRVTSQHSIISVEERQANWAEYLLLRRGIPLEGRLFNPDNQRYAQKYAPGDQPPAWVDRGREPRNVVDRLGDLL
jgi:hypothetical protein